jgi:hypothetical protein
MHAFNQLDRILGGIHDKRANMKAAGNLLIELQARGVASVTGYDFVFEVRDTGQGSNLDRGAVPDSADVSFQVSEGFVGSGERSIVAILERRGPNPLRIQLQHDLATRELRLEFFNAGLEPSLKLHADLTHIGRRPPCFDGRNFFVGGGEGAEL